MAPHDDLMDRLIQRSILADILCLGRAVHDVLERDVNGFPTEVGKEVFAKVVYARLSTG
jgi:hypothetical protein